MGKEGVERQRERDKGGGGGGERGRMAAGRGCERQIFKKIDRSSDVNICKAGVPPLGDRMPLSVRHNLSNTAQSCATSERGGQEPDSHKLPNNHGDAQDQMLSLIHI